jgi:hypothetical protein
MASQFERGGQPVAIQAATSSALQRFAFPPIVTGLGSFPALLSLQTV